MATERSNTTIPASRGVRSSLGKDALKTICPSFTYPIARPPTMAALVEVVRYILTCWRGRHGCGRHGCYSMRKGSGTFKCWAHRGVGGGGPTSGCCYYSWRAPLTVSFVRGMGVRMESTYSAASPAPPNRSQGVQSAFTSAAGACISCCFATGCCCSDGVAATLRVATASDRGLIASFAARSSARRLSWCTRLTAAPARPAATFGGSFILGTTGAGAGAVTLSTGTTCSTPFVDSGVGWISSSIWLIRSRDYSGNIMLSKSAVSQCG